MTFTKQQLLNFRAYEDVRLDGKFNMFDPRARKASGLQKSEYIFVMAHYADLKKAYEAAEDDYIMKLAAHYGH